MPSAHTIVFEGDQLADPADNPQLRALLESGPQAGVGAQKAWLGSAVAIKEPTFASFGRHAGSNLLVVGAWDESALGVLANAVIALAVQCGDCPLFLTRGAVPGEESEQEKGTVPLSASSGEGGSPLFASDISRPGGDPNRKKATVPSIYILDGTRPEAPEAGAWQRMADALPGLARVVSPRETPDAIREIAQELSNREAESRDDAPPIYLVIFNGGRFRDLRRGEDDYSFSFDKDKPPSPDKQFAEILRNGPAWGIHTLLWCDSNNNVNRLLDRTLLREFEMRVAFQMSAADSASLLDNPAASRLRQHRGLFASEDLGTLEKFRPYGPPTDEWLEIVRKSLRRVTRITQS
jgi:hypothetical protein